MYWVIVKCPVKVGVAPSGHGLVFDDGLFITDSASFCNWSVWFSVSS